MTTVQMMKHHTGETPSPDTVILTHKLTREYVMGADGQWQRK